MIYAILVSPVLNCQMGIIIFFSHFPKPGQAWHVKLSWLDQKPSRGFFMSLKCYCRQLFNRFSVKLFFTTTEILRLKAKKFFSYIL